MKFLQNKIKSFLYDNDQIGLVFILFFIILVHLPSMIYGSIFFIPITNDEVDYYTKFGAWFTALGAIFTIINTVIVIYLMIFLHKKQIDISLFPYENEFKKRLIDIEIILRSEIEYFGDNQFKTSENLYDDHYGNTGSPYDHVYRQEIKNLDQIIKEVKELYSIFLTFKSEANSQPITSLKNFKEKLDIINNLDENLALNKPSSEYKKGFIEGSKVDAEPDEMIEVAKTLSLESIKKITILFKDETT